MSGMEDIDISLRTFQDDESKMFGVEVIVSGLVSQDQADRAMDYVQIVLCGAEKTVN